MRKFHRQITAAAGALSLSAALVLAAEPASGETEYGRYSCRVDEVYGRDGLGQAWKHGTLVFDADAGTLHGAADPGGGLRREGVTRTPTRMFSRLKVETIPSDVSNLHAVQYDPAPPSVTNPIMAWIMIETLDDPRMPRFQFFSTTVRSVLSGRCIKEGQESR